MYSHVSNHVANIHVTVSMGKRKKQHVLTGLAEQNRPLLNLKAGNEGIMKQVHLYVLGIASTCIEQVQQFTTYNWRKTCCSHHFHFLPSHSCHHP